MNRNFTMSELWEAYRCRHTPHGASEISTRVAMRIFYAGAHGVISNIMPQLPRDQAMALADEFEAFYRDVKAGIK